MGSVRCAALIVTGVVYELCLVGDVNCAMIGGLFLVSGLGECMYVSYIGCRVGLGEWFVCYGQG